jgi:hypothetical protein
VNTISVRLNVALSLPFPRTKHALPSVSMTRFQLGSGITSNAQVADYQGVINEVLRQRVRQACEPLEKIIRRVIREELSRAS